VISIPQEAPIWSLAGISGRANRALTRLAGATRSGLASGIKTMKQQVIDFYKV
jgi:hypothetical protein